MDEAVVVEGFMGWLVAFRGVCRVFGCVCCMYRKRNFRVVCRMDQNGE